MSKKKQRCDSFCRIAEGSNNSWERQRLWRHPQRELSVYYKIECRLLRYSTPMLQCAYAQRCTLAGRNPLCCNFCMCRKTLLNYMEKH